MELINRLYSNRGWITSHWSGNGGRSSAGARDSLYDEAPANLSKQPNGSITSVGPGDVVSINEYQSGAFLADGHALVVNTAGTASSGTIPLVSQNSGSSSSATPQRNATLSGGTLTLPSSGAYSYSVIGVVHAPGAGSGSLEGSLVSHNGEVYRIAGGAPLYVSSWDAVGGSQPSTPLSDAAFSALRQYPADGTLVNVNSGYVYEFVGGAPLYVSSWEAIGGARPSVLVDQSSLDNHGASPWNHTLAYPADGTMVNVASGYVYRFAGGAPIYVSSWESIGGAQPSTRIDQGALDTHGAAPWNHTLAYPADGTFLNGGSTGAVYRVTSGIATYVPSWAPYGGPQPVVTVDQGAIDNAGLGVPWNYLRSGKPTVTMTKPASLNVSGTSYTFKWSAPVQSSALTTYDARRASALIGKKIGAWSQPPTWQNITRQSVSVALRRNSKYCVEVRGHNRAGMLGPWSSAVCVQRP